jgi:hypothetical protein
MDNLFRVLFWFKKRLVFFVLQKNCRFVVEISCENEKWQCFSFYFLSINLFILFCFVFWLCQYTFIVSYCNWTMGNNDRNIISYLFECICFLIFIQSIFLLFYISTRSKQTFNSCNITSKITL